MPELLLGAHGRLGHLEPFANAVAVTLAARDTAGRSLSLTNRELTILRDLPSVLTLTEIADAHVISVNTVKTHLRSMYRKLEVGGRAQAVQRARRLGIY
ncbi:LuxR C-terminal-related transcriptional regulator [Pengzhenrongella sicca]|uniref:Response regulator transcription factor n=1 Tax=Pengzhenrongella sicca TaxID=2819238 RepID=A0A8A4ZII2_9MICO|nr:LuxR C-terminal-related transcriptional regulator [Pengzhenrongella sicca]QTE29418.1 response regulator transcription factor [Pengzhenrongella sicca]